MLKFQFVIKCFNITIVVAHCARDSRGKPTATFWERGLGTDSPTLVVASK
jgi:hypothetical protein